MYRDSISRNSPDSIPCLGLPESDDEIHVNMYKSHRKYHISITEVRTKFEKLRFEYQSLRHLKQDLSMLYSLPKGTFRELDAYYSIQEQFPDCYGINSYGVPASFPAETRARAKPTQGVFC